jgi:site-specific recombinase
VLRNPATILALPTIGILLAHAPGPETTWEERARWWADLVEHLTQDEPAGHAYARFDELLAWCDLHPEDGHRLGSVLIRSLAVCEPGRTLTEAGIPIRPTLVGELLRRFVAKVIPPVAEPLELEDLVDVSLGNAEHVTWLAGLPADRLVRFAEVTGLDRTSGWPELRQDVAVAIGVLAARICSEGLGDEARRTIHDDHASQGCFLRLSFVGAEIARQTDPGGQAGLLPELGRAVDGCSLAIDRIVARMGQHAVSADLVYRMERARCCLGRIRQLASLLAPQSSLQSFLLAHAFLVHLCQSRNQQSSIRRLIAEHTHLLAKRVVLHAASTGKTYITGGYAEWRTMLSAAIGGGFVMAVALHAKLALGLATYPDGIAWLVFGCTYASAFAWMHLAHWTLATKQPPVTAAALAQCIGTGDQGAILDLVRRLVRSQLASVIGNLLAVCSLGAASALLWHAATGDRLLSDGMASGILTAHDPLGSGVVFFAAETGVVLYLSGLLNGWLSNQAQGRNLARSFARNSILRYAVAPERRDAWAATIARNLPGLGTAIALGFMLAALPVVGAITGLPCDLRHVTISAGSVTMALASQPEALASSIGIAAIAGVLLVGLINILVGFSCALFTALRADGQPIRSAFPLLRRIVGDALRRPLAYVLPFNGGTGSRYALSRVDDEPPSRS